MKYISIEKFVLISAALILCTALLVDQYKTNQFKDSIADYHKTSITSGDKLANLIELVENNDIEKFNKISCVYLMGYLNSTIDTPFELSYTDYEKTKIKHIKAYIEKYKKLGMCSF